MARLRAAAAATTVPVIASGGFGDPLDLKRASEVGTSAVAIADALHWQRTTVGEIKSHARQQGLEVRL